MSGFNTESTPDTKMSPFALPKSIVGCEKQNRLDRAHFKQPPMEIITNTSHDAYQQETIQDLYLLQKRIVGDHNINGYDNVDISELFDFFFLNFEVSRLETNMQYAAKRTGINLECARDVFIELHENQTY